jgi:hypothetical protein
MLETKIYHILVLVMVTEISECKSESGTSDHGSKSGVSHAGMNHWLQFTHSDPGPSTSTSVQNIERKAIVRSSFDWITQPVQWIY